jgi:peptide/nickel transport system permease protein
MTTERVESAGVLPPRRGPFAPGFALTRWFVGHATLRVVARRLLLAVPLLFIVSILSFVLVSLTPGDAAQQILGVEATPEQYAALRHAMGLDRPLYTQYWHWLQNALHGDFGVSLITSQPVTQAIDQRLPVTASLIVGALLLTTILGVSIGAFSAVRGGIAGRFVDAFALAGFALPSFWLGAALIALFAVRLHWFPATGYVPFAESPDKWFLALVLPVIALALHSVAAIAKQTRESMLDALSSEYVRMARASGVSRSSIVMRHAFKNASIRVATILGLLTVGLLGGTVFVESVFALPGLGSLAVSSSLGHDLPMIQGVVVYFTVIVVVVNLLIDLAYTWLDPRLRTR